MCYAGSRPMGRLFHWAMAAVLMVSGLLIPMYGATPPNSPAKTTVADTVYMADGTTAQGTLIITWPPFVTAGGTAVAAGTANVTLGASGALSVALVPNADATPAGVYYTVVYQLGPGQVRSENWFVPNTSPASLATVRATPGTGFASQPVSMQYVNSVLAGKADNSNVVHLNGSETIAGTKTFASSPSVPTPITSSDLATKGYVDQSLANVGSGNFLSTAGGTMLGPIVLSGELGVMSETTILSRQRSRNAEKSATGVPYTAKDFQLEVLDRLAEMQEFARGLEVSWTAKLEAVREQRLLKFDSRTLIALGAIALSLSGYVIQDARNSARQDSELESTKARVLRLEQIAATNTEGRIRTEVELGELRVGQNEIKGLIQAHDVASKKMIVRK